MMFDSKAGACQLSLRSLGCQVRGDLQIPVPCHQLLIQALSCFQTVRQGLDLCFRR